jgi:hypothetical protein
MFWIYVAIYKTLNPEISFQGATKRPTAGVRLLRGYPLMGGTRGRHFAGTKFKPRKLPENAQTPTTPAPALARGSGAPIKSGAHFSRQKPSIGCARLGLAQATVATAHAMARVVYKMLKYKVEYDPLSVNEYQKRYEEQQVKYMRKRAAKFGYQLIPS